MHNHIGRLKQHSWFSYALPWVICFVAALFYCYEYLLRILPGTMVPQLQSAFGTHGLQLDATQIGNLSAFYYYAYSPMQLPVGVMMDKHGPRWVITMAVFACAIGACLFGMTTSLVVAQIGRFMMGFGSAFAFVGVLKLASSWLPPNRFAFMAGLTTALSMFCAMKGTTLLTELNTTIGWQKTVIGLACIGIILLPITWLVIRDEPENAVSIDSTELGYKNLFTDILFSFRNSQIWINGLVGCFMMAPTVIFAELWGSQYLESVHGLSKLEAPKALSMIFLGWAFGGPIMGFLSDFLRRRKIPLMLNSFATGIVLAIFVLAPGLSMKQIYLLMFLTGFFSGAEIIVFAVGRENCPSRLAATVVAVTNFVVVMGALLQVLTGYVLDLYWSGIIVDGVKIYSRAENQMAMLILPLCSLLAFLLCFFLRETFCQSFESQRSRDDQVKPDDSGIDSSRLRG